MHTHYWHHRNEEQHEASQSLRTKPTYLRLPTTECFGAKAMDVTQRPDGDYSPSKSHTLKWGI